MARMPEDRSDPRPGATRDDPADTATLRPNARTSVGATEAPRHRGGRTLWLVLAAVVAILVVFYFFSGGLGTGSAVDDNVDVAPGNAVGGAVEGTSTTTPPAPGDGTAPSVPPPAAGN